AGFVGLGFVFGEPLLRAAHTIGAVLGIALAAAFLGYLGWKLATRYRLLAHLRTARIEADELVRLLGRAFVVDLRHRADVATDPRRIGGAVQIPSEELEARLGEIPRDREIVLYCT